MNRIILIVFSLIATSTVFSQTASVEDRRQELQKQISAGLIENRIADVVKAGTELAAIEKSLGDANLPNYAVALTNLALWKQRLNAPAYSDSAEGGRQGNPKLLKEAGRIRLEIRSHLEEAIALYRSKIDDPAQLGSVLYEYGNYVCREPIETDDLSRLSEPLRESLAIRDRDNSNGSDSLINVLFTLSECEFNIGNFAEYYGAYTRLLPAMEKRFGTESKKLVPVLITFERFLILTDRESQAVDVTKRISTIVGANYEISTPEEIIMLRYVGKREKLRGRMVESVAIPNRRVSVPDPLTPATVGTMLGRPGITVITYPTRTIDRTDSSVIMRSRQANLVTVSIVVDESGSVIEANAQVANEKVKKRVERKVKAWKFRPLIIDGVGRRMIGEVLVNS